MVSDEYEIPVKVVDRRRWREDGEANPAAAPQQSLKPTYVEELERQVADKDRLIQEYIGKYRQATSEFEEARLRLRREIAKDVERARREVLAELLEVVDNLDRAVDAAGPTASLESVVQGIEMVRRQFIAKLEALGVSRVDATGQPFDPQVHEAVTTVPAASPEEDGIVMGVIRHGYRMGDDVLRPASVAVGRR